MRLLLRKRDGASCRPVPPRDPLADFSGDNDGALVVEHGDVLGDLDIYVLAGDDMHPATHYSYEASLYTLDGRLVVRTIRRTDSSEIVDLRISEDDARTWRVLETAPLLDTWRLVDRIEAG